MGLLNSALQIGRSAILGYESALQVVGSNISSAGSPDYTRLSPELSPVQGNLVADGIQPGAGVALTGIRRNIDESLEARLRLAIGDSHALTAQQGVMAQVEALFDDVSGAGVSDQLTVLLTSLEDLQNNPEDLATRDLVLHNGEQLAESLRNLRSELLRVGADTDEQIAQVVEQADSLAEEIALLNQKIAAAESTGPGQASGLRDQRDALLRQLGELIHVSVREQPNGTVNVYIGSEALVQGNSVRHLTTVTTLDGVFERTSVHFADNQGEVAVTGGRLAGLMIARDQHANARIAAVDELAGALIYEMNRLHADGQGLTGLTSATSGYTVADPTARLGSPTAGLPFPVQHGSFYLTVRDDASGTPVAYQIQVDLDGIDDDTTLESLVADINATVTGVTASITADNRLSLAADAGYSFTFGNDGVSARPDTSGVLAALDVNTFFTGTDAASIAVNDGLLANPSLLAAASTFAPGDGSNAGRMAALDETASTLLGGVSIPDFYEATAGNVAITAANLNSDAEAAAGVLSALQAQRESISGVNLDEEAINLLKFERAFQGAARYLSTVSSLLQELMTILR